MSEQNENWVLIALGSNLDDPKQKLLAAIDAIDQLKGVTVEKKSSFYVTTPVGYVEQDDFINAVVAVKTEVDAEALLGMLQEIENAFGRVRTFQNAPRTLDLDIIDYAHQKHHSKTLILPHPRAHERGFVMVPLAEILPNYRLSGQDTASALAVVLQEQGVRQLTESQSA